MIGVKGASLIVFQSKDREGYVKGMWGQIVIKDSLSITFLNRKL